VSERLFDYVDDDLNPLPFPPPWPPEPPRPPSWDDPVNAYRLDLGDGRAPAPAPCEPDSETGEDGCPYRVRSDSVWQAAKADYLDGAAAETVCERYDLGLSAFRQRARREGWRRLDAEDASVFPPAYPPTLEAEPSSEALAELAWRSVAQAIRRGRVYEARAWVKLAAELKAKADAERAAEAAAEEEARLKIEREAEVETVAKDVRRLAVEAGRVHGLHSKEGVQSAADEAEDEEPKGEKPEDEEPGEEADDVPDGAPSRAQLRRWVCDLENGGDLYPSPATVARALRTGRRMLAERMGHKPPSPFDGAEKATPSGSLPPAGSATRP